MQILINECLIPKSILGCYLVTEISISNFQLHPKSDHPKSIILGDIGLARILIFSADQNLHELKNQ